jgi:hypothetical protein
MSIKRYTTPEFFIFAFLCLTRVEALSITAIDQLKALIDRSATFSVASFLPNPLLLISQWQQQLKKHRHH